VASIQLDKVCIDFPIYGVKTRSIKHQLIRVSTGGRFNDKYSNDKHNEVITIRALDDLSLTIGHGDRIGLIGHNGAGKSTLLRVLAKIYQPTQGTVQIEGRVSALLDIMLGMEADSTGYDNIVLRGILQGLTFKQILAKQSEIAEFTELGDYLSMPVRTYSAGMKVRLAFAIATSITSQILILDEVINAGDAAFRHKAERRIKEVITNADIVVVASHELDLIKEMCNKVICLDQGKLAFFGDLEEGIALYNEKSK